MIYNTGTISINGNTATGTGTNWTAAASQIRVSQTIIVLSNPVQMFQITAINSGTSLTVTPAASPALSGQKYGILITDSLSVDGLAQSMSQLINEYDENIGAWETFASTSANQTITVTINGVSVTIPALGKLAQKGSNGAVPIAQGGHGGTTAAEGRTNLGLGSSATRDVGTTSGTVAAGDDSRLNTVDGKSGGVIKGNVTIDYGGVLFLRDTEVEGVAINAVANQFADSSWRPIVVFGATAGRKSVLLSEGGVLCKAGLDNWSNLRTSYFLDYESGPIALYIDSTRVGTLQLATTSDKFLKKEIEYLSDKNVMGELSATATALSEVMEWKPATFKFKKRGIIPESETKLGFIANDLIIPSPECVKGKGLEEGFDENNAADAYSLDETAMIAKLTLSIQELQKQIAELQGRNV
ncbi:tail fiber domain-containing protein [Salmonella enterica]|uniref:Tail fiber domain-containing protein n=1 Tax=Salmonella typhimurium TaxID=90371 RepID=A0A710GZ92_SALTM|nr:tail fiber domain-containing protein [Salmonella enterica]EAA3760775.1 tail fiber domain-containing protein [Salmonella enterica subsp. enterica]HAD1024228.1 tail fiber domain-containing protein [Salmonella enterica subsp. enterica serovar Typhimurium]ECE6978985.1 tail fiber domain-containing protein [Salmonella enterica subsp. enterica]ELG6172646.1 tail fiber domain-containing protein [Salmonella enterica]ELM0516999.1 tail fiber domain-containing protein [Salmonella enterica]